MQTPRDEGRPVEESLELVRRAQAGDGEAFEDLLARYYPRVLGVVRKRLGAELRADLDSGDVVQEAMVQVVRTFDRFDMQDEKALIRWLAAVVENRLRDVAKYVRAEKRAKGPGGPGVDSLGSALEAGRSPTAPDEPPSPLSEVQRREEVERLGEGLRGLKVAYRDVIQARRDGLTWSEVAERLGLPTDGAARLLHSRAIVALMKALNASGDA